MPTTSAGPRSRTVTGGAALPLTDSTADRSATACWPAPSESGVVMLAAAPWRTQGRRLRLAAGSDGIDRLLLRSLGLQLVQRNHLPLGAAAVERVERCTVFAPGPQRCIDRWRRAVGQWNDGPPGRFHLH